MTILNRLWKIRLLQHTYGWFMVRATTFVVRRPQLQLKITMWMEKHPRLYSKMQQQVMSRGISYKRRSRKVHAAHIGPGQAELEAQILKASEKWNLGRRLDV